LLIGFFIGCLFGGIFSFIFFVKKIAEYKKRINDKYNNI